MNFIYLSILFSAWSIARWCCWRSF